MAVLVTEDLILILRGAVDAVETVWLVAHQLGGDLLREKYLAGVRGVSRLIGRPRKMAANPHLEMYVVGAAHVEAGKDGLKIYRTVGSRQLNTAQEGQLVGGMILRRRSHVLRGRRASWATEGRASWPHRILFRESRVETESIAVPQIHGRVGQGLARSRVEHQYAKRKRHAGFAFHDVGTEELARDVIWPFLLLWDQPAHFRVRSERRTLKLQRGRKSSTANQEAAASKGFFDS